MYRRDEEPIEYKEGEKYSNAQMEQIANQFLREDAKAEICASCGLRGEDTGIIEAKPQNIENTSGDQLVLGFKKFACENGHDWFRGEGKERGIGGEDPILFEEHIQSRKKREIYCQSGVPDPNIVQGSYNKSHPQGRKINSPAQRAAHGASYYRAYIFLPMIMVLDHVWHHLT